MPSWVALQLLLHQTWWHWITSPSLRTAASLRASRTSTQHLVDVLLGRTEEFDLLKHSEIGKLGREELAAQTSALCTAKRAELEATLSVSLRTALSRRDMTWLPDHLKPDSSWLAQLPQRIQPYCG
jgi:hypothetical protein